MSFPDTTIESTVLVSVIIPTYNRRQYVLEAIRSVTNQTYKHWELIIVDDGSVDDTIEMIKALNDSRIRIIENEHKGHVGWLRNKAVAASTGSFIAFLDSDDLWMPQKLALQIKSIQYSNKNCCYCGHELIDEAGNKLSFKTRPYTAHSGWIAEQIISAEAAVSIGSLLIERTLFDEAGGFSTDEEINFREDYEFVLRIAMKTEIIALPDILVQVREHSKRSTNRLVDSNERTAATFTKFLATNPADKLAKAARIRRGYHLAEAAVKNLQQKKYLLAATQLRKSFIDDRDLRHLLSSLKRGFLKHA